MYYKIDIALKENKSVLQEIKNKVCGNIEKQSIYFWEKNFYSDNKFDNKKYLDYVSKK